MGLVIKFENNNKTFHQIQCETFQAQFTQQFHENLSNISEYWLRCRQKMDSLSLLECVCVCVCVCVCSEGHSRMLLSV